MTLKNMGSTYGFTADELVRGKLKIVDGVKTILNESYTDEFKNGFKDSIENLEGLLKMADESDYDSIIKYICYFLQSHDYSDYPNKFINVLFVIKFVVHGYYKKADNFNIDSCSELLHILEVLSGGDKLRTEEINTLLKNIGIVISKMKIVENTGIDKNSVIKASYVTPLDMDNSISVLNSCITENADMSGGTIIKSITNYSTVKNFPQLTRRVFDAPDYLMSLFQEKDDDYIVNKAYKLSEFINAAISTTDNPYESIKTVVDFFYGKFTTNSTGMNILKDQLEEIISKLPDMITLRYDKKDTIESIIEYLKTSLENVNTALKEFNNPDVMVPSTPLIEMGFGYIYDIIPSNIEELSSNDCKDIGRLLTEAIDSDTVFEVLNEGIFSRLKKEREEEEYKRQEKRETEKMKRQDDYEMKKQKKQDKYEAKKQKKQDKYEDMKQKEKDEYEAKKEKKEKRKAATKTAGVKWKTIKLTTPAVYSAVRALKRLIVAVGIGGVSAAAGLNPIFLPILYLIQRYMRDKTFPDRTKREIMTEIRQTLSTIDAKIEQAERQNDMKQKYSLMKMKDKLESLYNRNNFFSGRSAVI